MFLAERPGNRGSFPTLVAITILFRLPRDFIQRPMMVSDSPPELPGTQQEYMSAVSIKFPPAAAKASRTANDCCSFAVHPNTLPPSEKGKTFKAVRGILAMTE